MLRRDKQKASKDLYYIFDILTGMREILPVMVVDFEGFSHNHPGWFKKFKNNLRAQFESNDSGGPLRIVEQRPARTLSDLDDDQLKNFAFGTMDQFINKLETLGAP